MKKTLFISILILLSSVLLPAQNKRFCEILGHSKLFSTKVTVTIDFGQDHSGAWGRNDKIVDSTGKDIVFNSMVDAMNYLGSMGWHFEQAYVVTIGNANVYHWLLSKDMSDEPDEFKTRGMLKGQKPKKDPKKEKEEAIRTNSIYSRDQ